jgi:hypothetical protein
MTLNQYFLFYPYYEFTKYISNENHNIRFFILFDSHWECNHTLLKISLNYFIKTFIIMTSKLVSALSPIFTGAITVAAGLYLGERNISHSKDQIHINHKNDMELASMKYKMELDITKYKYDREEELMKTKSDFLNLLTNDTKSDLISTNSTGPVTQALSELHSYITESPPLGENSGPRGPESSTYNSVPSVLEYILVQSNPSQLFAIGLCMFNLTIFICIIGLIVNHYIKLYGEQYINKFPKWSLPIVRYYLKLGQYTNYYYILLIMVSLLFSTMTSFIIYFRNYFY